MEAESLAENGKIKTLEELEAIFREARSGDRYKKIVHCHGVFDLIHIGHIRHFLQAKSFGDLLVVTLTPDRFVNKGPHRPAFSEALRAEAVAALDVVDYVAVNRWPTAVEAIHMLRPDVYCKGGEYRQKQVDAESNMLPEVEAAREVGAMIEYTDDILFSSSELLNRHFSPFPIETDAWLETFRQKHSVNEVIKQLDRLRSLKALVIGEAIIDEYVFCNTIGKSTKDPVLACQRVSSERFVGGSLAIANHLAGFCDQVRLITYLGETERQEDFVRGALLRNVEPFFITKPESPTIHKRRFVDHYSQNKLLELYIMNDRPIPKEAEKELLERFVDALNDCDVVIAADYGHGLMTPTAIASLCDKSPFLAVNTQSNAGNRGFNPISKYRRADYVCLANHEVAIETRMREGNLRELLLEVAQRVDCARFTITLGKMGSLHYAPECGFVEVPAFATRVVDRVGAGDALFALTSLLVAKEVPWDIVGFVGNVAGAQLVTELGNRVPISRIPLAKHIISLLK